MAAMALKLKLIHIYMREEKIVAKVFDSQADTYGASTTAFGQFLADFEKKRILREFTDTKGLLLDVGTGGVDTQSSLRKWV